MSWGKNEPQTHADLRRLFSCPSKASKKKLTEKDLFVEYLLHILILIGIYVILSVSLNLIAGYAGLLSIAHAAFYGVGHMWRLCLP